MDQSKKKQPKGDKPEIDKASLDVAKKAHEVAKGSNKIVRK